MMYYRKIKLQEGNDFENEFSVGVEVANEDLMDEVIDSIFKLFRTTDIKIEQETVLDNYLLIRCWDITFDGNGLNLLKRIYDSTMKEIGSKNKVMINVHLDEWYTPENGVESNNDEVEWDEFLLNIKTDKLFCEDCRKDVIYMTQEQDVSQTINTKLIVFKEKVAKCITCGCELDHEEYENETFKRIEEKLKE